MITVTMSLHGISKFCYLYCTLYKWAMKSERLKACISGFNRLRGWVTINGGFL